MWQKITSEGPSLAVYSFQALPPTKDYHLYLILPTHFQLFIHHHPKMKVGKPISKRGTTRMRHKIIKASAAKQRKDRKLEKKVNRLSIYSPLAFIR